MDLESLGENFSASTCSSKELAGLKKKNMMTQNLRNPYERFPSWRTEGRYEPVGRMMNNPCGARRKRSGALDSCFGLVSHHQQSIPPPYLQAPRVIKTSSSAALVVLN